MLTNYQRVRVNLLSTKKQIDQILDKSFRLQVRETEILTERERDRDIDRERETERHRDRLQMLYSNPT